CVAAPPASAGSAGAEGPAAGNPPGGEDLRIPGAGRAVPAALPVAAVAAVRAGRAVCAVGRVDRDVVERDVGGVELTKAVAAGVRGRQLGLQVEVLEPD